MKTFITVFFALWLVSSGAQAQFEKGDWELGMTLSAGSYSESGESESSQYDQDSRYLAFNVMPGYYVIKGLSMEPEFGLYSLEQAGPTLQLLVNLSYTRMLPGERAAWFVRSGVGISNGIPFPGTNFTLFDTGESILILNFGGGLKVPVSQSVAVRTELNYKIYRFSRSYPDYYGNPGSETDYDVRDFGLRIGFSILL